MSGKNLIRYRNVPNIKKIFPYVPQLVNEYLHMVMKRLIAFSYPYQAQYPSSDRREIGKKKRIKTAKTQIKCIIIFIIKMHSG